MATQEAIQLSILRFKPTPSPPSSHHGTTTNGTTNGTTNHHNNYTTSPPSGFYDVCAQLQAVPGVAAMYLGPQLEDPDSWVWAIRWATGAALDAFVASPTYTRWTAGLRAVTDSIASSRASLSLLNINGCCSASASASAAAALGSPCTEVFTAFATDPNFLDTRMRPFAKCFEREHVPGFRGAAFGQWVPVTFENAPLPVGETVGMILGWDSKEAHLAQRGEGKDIFTMFEMGGKLLAFITSIYNDFDVYSFTGGYIMYLATTTL